MKNISVFDTSISDYNLGNQIIMDSVYKYLTEIFPQDFFFKLPFMEITNHTLMYIRWSDYIFFGGTNSLCAEMEKYNQWGVTNENSEHIQNVVLMGMGWWQYQYKISDYTIRLLNSVLSRTFLHSVRDSYAVNQLHICGFDNVINTGCPTLWELTAQHCAKIKREKTEKVLVTFTDYNQVLERDRSILNIVRANYSQIYFWIQGKGDYDYIKKNFFIQGDIIINPNLLAFNQILREEDIDYFGTRLHAGIRALQEQKRTIIIGIDNRAIEMAKDFGLPVIPQDEISARLEAAITSTSILDIKLPMENIKLWKDQFFKLGTRELW